MRVWLRTGAEIPIIERLLAGNSLSPNVFEVRTGGKGDDRQAEGYSFILFCFQARSERAARCCRGESVKIQAGKTNRTWLRAWVCLGQSRNGVAML